MKRSYKFLMSVLTALIVPAFGWAAEPWAAWTDFTGLTGSKAPDISSTQNSIAGSGFTFNLGSGVVQADGSLVTMGGAATEAPYINFNQGIDVGYNNNPITIVMTIEMPETLPTDDNSNTIVKPLWTVGSSGTNGIGLTVNALDETNGTTFGGAWANVAWNATNTEKLISASSIKPKQVITLVASCPNGSLQVKSLTDGATASLGSISELAGGSIAATRITLGNFHYTFDNKTISYRILNVAVFRGTSVSDADMALAIAPVATLESAEETWSEQWTDAPDSNDTVGVEVTAEGGSALNLDSAVTLKNLVTKGSAPLTVTGSALTVSGETRINVDTDISAIIASLGAVTINAGKTLAMSATTFAGADSFTRGNGAAIEIKGTDTLTAIPNKENFGNIFYTSGTFVLNQPLTIAEEGVVDFGKTHTVTLLKDITAHRIRTGNDSGITEVINQDGGTITLSNQETETINQNSAAILLGHWPCTTTYNLKSGNLLAESGMLIMGWDANNARLNIGQQSGEEALLSVKRFTSGRDNTAEITINPTGTLKIGARGLDLLSNDKFTLAGGTLAVADNATIAIPHTDGLNVTADSTISAPAEKTATINSTLKGSAALTLADGGTIDLSNAGKVYTGVISVEAGTTVILSEELLMAAGAITIPESATLKIKPSVSSLLLGKAEIELPEGSSINGTIEFVGVDTTPEYADNTIAATFSAQSATDTAWWNYEFKGNLSSTGSDTTELERDSGRPTWSTDVTSTDYKDGEALYTATHPYRGATYPSEWTAIISATLPAKENAVLMAFGTLDGGTIALIKGETLTDADGNVTSDEVILARTSGNAPYEVLASMQVPNSTTAAHTYAFVKTPRSINIYLDGSLWKPYTISADASDISFGGGFQIGSVHGGLGFTGYERPAGSEGDAENTTPSSYIDVLRTYTSALTAEAITLLSTEFPYVSPNGTYTRTTTADTDTWVADNAWTKAGTDPAETVAHPAAGAVAELTANAETTVTLNLDADEGLESLTLRGEKITFVADAEKSGKIINAGKTQIDTDVVIPVGSLDISGGPTMIAEGKTLTFTVSEAFLAQYYASTTIPLTGTMEETEAVTLQSESVSARATALTYNTTTQSYDLTITVDGELNAYVPAAGATWETLVWRLGDVEVNTPNDFSDLSFSLKAEEGAELTIAANVSANQVNINGGALTLVGEGKLVATTSLAVEANVSAPVEMISSCAAISIANEKILTVSSDEMIDNPNGQTETTAWTLPTLTGSGTLEKIGPGVIVFFNRAIEPNVIVTEGDAHIRMEPTTPIKMTAKSGTLIRLTAWNVSFTKENQITLEGGSGLVLANGVGEGTKSVNGTITIANAEETSAKIYGSSFGQVTLATAIKGSGKLEFAEGMAFSTTSTTNFPCSYEVLVSGVISEAVSVIVSETSNSVTFSGANTYTGSTKVTAGSTLVVAEGASIGAGDLVLNGTLTGSVTIASGKTLSGTGTISGDLALNSGATIDATAGALTVGGAVTLPADGTVTIAVDAEAEDGATLLTCAAADLNLAKITIDGAPDGATVAKNEGNTALVLVLPETDVCKIGEQGYSTLAEALEAAEVGQAIVLIDNVELTADATLNPGVTIQTDGYTITGAEHLKDIAGNVVEGTGGSYVAPTYEAVIGTTYYPTLAGAIEAAVDGNTIVLQDNLDVENTITVDKEATWMSSGITLDLNAKTLTSAAGTLFKLTNGLLTVKNGTIETSGVTFQIAEKNTAGANSAYMWGDTWTEIGKAHLNLDSDLAVTSTGDNCVLVYNGGYLYSEADLESQSPTWAAIQGTGLIGNPTRIVLADGSVKAVNHAIYHPQDGILMIGTADDTESGLPGNTVDISGVTGIEMRAGALNVVKANITATGTYTGPEANGNGSTVNGAAIALSQHTTDLPIIATITSAKLTADNGKTLVVADTTNAEEVVIDATIAAGIITDTATVDITVPTIALDGDATNGYTLTEVVVPSIVSVTIEDVTTEYETLAAALAALTDDATLTLLADVELTEDVTIDDNITLAIGAHTLTIPAGTTVTVAAEKTLTVTCDAGGLAVDGTIAVNGTLDVSALAYGETGLLAGKAGSLAIASTGTVKLMSVWDAYSPNWLMENSPTFFEGTEDGATIIQGSKTTTYDAATGAYLQASAVAVTTVTVLGQTYTEGFNTLADAVAAANAETTVKLLADVELTSTLVVTTTGVKIDLNGKLLKGTVAGTIVMNGGKYYSADNHYMAGPAGYYVTTDATFLFGTDSSITITAGSVSISKDMNTLPDQTLTIAEGVTFTVPAGKTINVLNTTIIVNGTLIIDGAVNLGGTYEGTTYTGGSITAGSGLAITSGVDGYKVVYAEGKYTLAKDITVSNEITIDGEESAKTLSADAMAVLQAIAEDADKSITSVNVPTEAHAKAVDAALQVFTDDIVTIENGVATVDWDFGISAITPVRGTNNEVTSVTITAKVQKGDATAAGYAKGTTVALMDGETKIATADAATATDGEVTFEVQLSALKDENGNARKLTVKATK